MMCAGGASPLRLAQAQFRTLTCVAIVLVPGKGAAGTRSTKKQRLKEHKGLERNHLWPLWKVQRKHPEMTLMRKVIQRQTDFIFQVQLVIMWERCQRGLRLGRAISQRRERANHFGIHCTDGHVGRSFQATQLIL
jgi:hypothetical protein